MSISIRNILLGNRRKKEPVLLVITPPRSGERTLLGVENLLAPGSDPPVSGTSEHLNNGRP